MGLRLPGRGSAARAAGVGLLTAAAVLLALGGPAQGGGEEAPRAGPASTRAAADGQDPFARGRALFARMGCGSCHRLAAGAGIGPVGPDLDALLPNHDAASLRAKIVDPYPAGPAESFTTMPEDYGRRMSDPQLDDLVAFLLATVRD